MGSRRVAATLRVVPSREHASSRPRAPEGSPADRLRALLAAPGLRVMPCCFDALSARIAEAYAGVPEEKGMAEIKRAAAEVRAEMKAERSRARARAKRKKA